MSRSALSIVALLLLITSIVALPSAAACDDAQWSDYRTILIVGIPYSGSQSCECYVGPVGYDGDPRELEDAMDGLCFASRDLIDTLHANGVP